MIDPTELERAAMQAALAPLGDYVASIGMERPLADYSRAEVLTLIEVVVTAYQDHMVEARAHGGRDRAFLRSSCPPASRLGGAVLMLDFNHRPADSTSRSAPHRCGPRRRTSGRSPVATISAPRASGWPASGPCSTSTCTPDPTPGAGFSGRMLRVFEVGHAWRTWPSAGCAWPASTCTPGSPAAGSSASRSPGGASRATSTASSNGGPGALGLAVPGTLGMQDHERQVLAGHGQAWAWPSPSPSTPRRSPSTRPTWRPAIPGIAENPALFTAINKDSQEIWFELVPFDGGLAQRMSDRAVRVISATEAGELLPRVTPPPRPTSSASSAPGRTAAGGTA